MSDSEPSVSFNIHGNVNQAAGKIENKDSHIGDINNNAMAPVNAERVFDTLKQAAPEAEQEKLEEQVFGPLRSELQTLTAMPIAQAEEQKQTFIERATALVQPLAPYSQTMRKVGLTFTEAALACLPVPANWFVSATLAAIRALNAEQS